MGDGLMFVFLLLVVAMSVACYFRTRNSKCVVRGMYVRTYVCVCNRSRARRFVQWLQIANVLPLRVDAPRQPSVLTSA